MQYRALSAAVESPVGAQQLAAMLQRAAKDPQLLAREFGMQDPEEAGRFLRAAGVLVQAGQLRGEMAAMQRQAMLEHFETARRQGNATEETVKSFQQGMRDALRAAHLGYAITQWMYVSLFVLGFLLVVGAAWCGIVGIGGAWGAALAFVGGASTITALLFGQQRALESSRADLMQLQIAVFAWLDNIVRLNGAANAMANTSGVSAELIRDLWKQSHDATEDVLNLVQVYCENRGTGAARVKPLPPGAPSDHAAT